MQNLEGIHRHSHSQMGSKKLQVLFVLLFLMYVCVFAASSPTIQRALSSDSSKDVDLADRNIQHEHGTRSAYGKDYAGGGIAQGQKIAHGTGFGEHSGGSTGTREHGNGGSESPYIYAGGAASNHHPNTHHSASSCNQNCVGLFTSILTAVASLVHLYIEWQT